MAGDSATTTKKKTYLCMYVCVYV